MKALSHHFTGALAGVALTLLLFGLAPAAFSGGDDDGVDLTFKPPAQQEMMKQMERWQATMKPSKWHTLLERFVGDWETTTKIFMAGPDGPAMESQGTMTYSWRVKGKWLESSGKGSMMGTPVEYFGLMGYDNFKQKYVSVFHDSMGTNLLPSEGTLNKDATELMLWGPMDEPMTGQTDKSVLYKYRFVSPDEIVFEVHDLHIGGTKTCVVEVAYKRSK